MIEAATWEDGVLRLRVTGPVGPEYRLEGTRDFLEWTRFESSRPSTLPVEWRVPGDATDSGWFFRIALVP